MMRQALEASRNPFRVRSTAFRRGTAPPKGGTTNEDLGARSPLYRVAFALRGWRIPLSFLCVLCVSVVSSSAVEPWATYRGNSERTGCTDGKAGPAAPKILWAVASKEHYVASPVP